MKRRVQRGLSVSPEQNQRIKALSERHQISEAAVVRQLIDAALPFAESGQAIDHARLVTLIEYASLALDTLVHRLSPADAEPLLERAIANARTYHAPQG
ncbi:hypothetical protein [Novosphingobium sp. Fuku2-ISO-50]|uniref:hypothetical protein n=1 Tax=Novosphingobium sp. Fuku2-ISO-50 TaxID=1739114 RepID=UPI00076D1026|nr:hypothetical protein [Novosphingobium sp. Fuku2-ISO-50]KUR75320.1 hypothetical protein AQZ50_15790 [Novosphingobium sp. Fuku2-ISO-50]